MKYSIKKERFFDKEGNEVDYLNGNTIVTLVFDKNAPHHFQVWPENPIFEKECLGDMESFNTEKEAESFIAKKCEEYREFIRNNSLDFITGDIDEDR